MYIPGKIFILMCLLVVPLTGHAVNLTEHYFDGIIEPSETVEISSEVPGVLDRVLMERGDRVAQGQVVAQLRSGLEASAVELARARVAFGQRKAARNEELYAKELLSIHEKDELETEIKINQMQLQEALEKLKMRTIRSPIDGLVAERLKSAGEYVSDDPILRLVRVDPLYVEVIAPVAMLGVIRKGMTAEVQPEAPLKGLYKGKVIVVDQVVDAASGTFGVRVQLPNARKKIIAGLRCRVRFVSD